MRFLHAASRQFVNEPDPPPAANATQLAPSTTKSNNTIQTTPDERRVAIDDDELTAMAVETKRSIEWRSVALSARFGPERWQPQNENAGFRVYTRQESQRYDVLAVGVVPGCLGEILNVLQSPSSELYAQHMESIFGREYHNGEILHRVGLDRAQTISDRESLNDEPELVDLSVNSLTFNKANWFASHEEWCYLDAVFRGGRDRVVEKFMTTMQSKEILAGTSAASTLGTSSFHDVVCGYLLRPGANDECDHPPSDDDSQAERDVSQPKPQGAPRETRVSFYAEYQIPKQIGYSRALTNAWRRSLAASDRTVKQRLLKLANSTARLTTLVRRQRLGMQVLADTKRFLPPTNVPCKVCERMLGVAKQCCVCGQGVCRDCSEKHERMRQPRGRRTLEVTHIRVCTDCLTRIDQADYANLTTSSLLGTHVVPDSPGGKPARLKLKELLEDALLTAPSPSRQASVKNVIHSLVDPDNDKNDGSSSLLLTDLDVVAALDKLVVAQIPADDVALRSDDHRCYLLDTSGSAAVPTPVPEDEEARLLSVEGMSGSELATVIELEILCDLAAREMGCATSAISLVDRDEYYGVASNSPALRNARIPRTQTICSHTMMEKELPNLVIHPEADIRFSKFDSVRELGVRFYCAFPLIGEDNQVIGTMCCLHGESLEITESQIAAFKKLAATASKVMRVETRKRRRKESSTSTAET